MGHEGDLETDGDEGVRRKIWEWTALEILFVSAILLVIVRFLFF